MSHMFSSKSSGKNISLNMINNSIGSQDKPLFTICYLLAFQVKKFVGLFEMLKHEKTTDDIMLCQIEKIIVKFGIYFQQNLF